MRLIILALLVAIVSVSLCTAAPEDTQTTPQDTQDITDVVTPTTPQAPVATIEPITITGPTEISAEQCSLRKIDGKALVIHAPGCAECPSVVSKLEEYELELGKTVEYISTDSEAHRLTALKISIENVIYLPAVILDCKVYTGNMGDKFYKDALTGL